MKVVMPALDSKANFSMRGSKELMMSPPILPATEKKDNPEIAIPLYEKFIELLKLSSGLKVESGSFGADMKINLCNDGPVTIWLDSKNKE